MQLRQAFQYLCHYGANMPQSTTAVLLFKILLRIMELSDNPLSLKQGALNVVNQIVSISWFDWRDIKVLFIERRRRKKKSQLITFNRKK
jgi:hypothetical protein